MTNLSRRKFLQASAAVLMQTLSPSGIPRLAFARNGVQGDVLVCVFLRGGADGLNMIVPFGDDNYYRARPTLAVARPDDNRSDTANRAIALDDFFGLNPDMGALYELFTTQHMTAIHAVGSPNISHCHVEARDLLERGADGKRGTNSGWLGRHLTATSTLQDSPLRAIGWNETPPASLGGYAAAATLERLNRLNTVRRVDVDTYRPANGANYTETDFGRALKQTAVLIKAGVGLEVACVDLGNFDTHITQGVTIHQTNGIFPGLVMELAGNLRAFHDDLLDYADHVTVVTLSEFGRRVQENGAGGTDHGHGGVMLIMSEHVTSQPVHALWPSLNADFLADGDLATTTDYRDVLGEILVKRTPHADLSTVFPGHSFKPVGIIEH